MTLNINDFNLVQAESPDIYDWVAVVPAGTYTRWYSDAVFKTNDGVYMAPWDNLKNYRKI